MGNKRYIAGRNFEYKIKKWFEKDGSIVIRSAGSHSMFDLVVLSPSTDLWRIEFWQLKKNTTEEEVIKIIREIGEKLNLKEDVIMNFEEYELIPSSKTKVAYLQKLGGFYTSGIKITLRFGVIYTLKKKNERRNKKVSK